MTMIFFIFTGCAAEPWADGAWQDSQGRPLAIFDGHCDSDGAVFPCTVDYQSSTQARLQTTRGSKQVNYQLARTDRGLTMSTSSGREETLTRSQP
ncbi:MAG: hypothetical protein ACI9VR_002538 [Cognaticolwellia sp.]|jgi:hypothetical protein